MGPALWVFGECGDGSGGGCVSRGVFSVRDAAASMDYRGVDSLSRGDALLIGGTY